MKVTLGGDRLGSGNKNKIALRNYERSTHNLSQRWASSMGSGILYPFLCIPAMRGDSFEIDLAAAARTIPTRGPLFGSFKMQLDLFQCPFRLYQAILHNNPTAIGLKMSQVKLPKIQIKAIKKNAKDWKVGKMNNSCLLKYLGLSGIGTGTNTGKFTRNILAIPALAYYDIFKSYYSNKQEQNAYVIKPKKIEGRTITNTYFYNENGDDYHPKTELAWIGNWTYLHSNWRVQTDTNNLTIEEAKKCIIQFWYAKGNEETTQEDLTDKKLIGGYTLGQLMKGGQMYEEYKKGKFGFYITDLTVSGQYIDFKLNFAEPYFNIYENYTNFLTFVDEYDVQTTITNLSLTPFDLRNIDDMRLAILSKNNLGNPFMIEHDNGDWNDESGTDETGLPYTALTGAYTIDDEIHQNNEHALNGLVLKTYQSDLFNNWVNTEWIDGENGIAEITKIATTDGAFKIDALNLAEKLYNMLNRIAVSGGTYEDWQDAVYTQSPRRHIESPIYLGGMSNEVVFEEIVQTAPAGEGESATELGTLGGRGTLIKRKGGNVSVKVDEASFIIGIVSLTPRIYQTQGNEFYMTELDTMDDLHKPALDGIGFQNLIGERLAWWDTSINPAGDIVHRSVIGKVPAWIEYMTALDKAYGDFAEEDGKGFMILNRNYEHDETTGGIADATTYIDPSKYNYAFAYTELDAQNFWVQIDCKIIARRLMSAKQIPNI